MFDQRARLEYRENAYDTVVPAATAVAWAESDVRQQRLAAERAVDSVLADSFPASDPPSWNLGITRPQPERRATNVEVIAQDRSRAALIREAVVDVSRPTMDGRTVLRRLVSWAGAAGIALLVPLIILLIGMPIVLAVRGVVEAVSWLLALIMA